MITTFVRILSVFRVLFPLHGCTPFFVCIWYFMLSIFQEPTIMCLTQFMSVSPLKTQMCHCMYVPSTRIRGATAPPQCVEWERLNKIIHRINWMTVNPSKAVLQLTNSQQAKKKKKFNKKKTIVRREEFACVTTSCGIISRLVHVQFHYHCTTANMWSISESWHFIITFEYRSRVWSCANPKDHKRKDDKNENLSWLNNKPKMRTTEYNFIFRNDEDIFARIYIDTMHYYQNCANITYIHTALCMRPVVVANRDVVVNVWGNSKKGTSSLIDCGAPASNIASLYFFFSFCYFFFYSCGNVREIWCLFILLVSS